ncbi:MAG: PQQ-binding-like beta-propeller repeat protein [Deltaproteobacteria bacterium]|nr:PQQ-binding-like beta-propeller repeat protein [Deltaproteobacteria bacterium]
MIPRPALAAILFSASCAAACGASRPVDSGWTHKPGVSVLRLRWVKRLAPPLPNFLLPELVEQHDRFHPLETASAAFDTDMKRAFIGASIGGFYCIALFDGATVWRFDLNHAVGGRPLYDARRKHVYFGADDGLLYALHARSGRLLWSIDLGAEVRREIYQQEGTLYFATADNAVYAVDADSGKVVWQYRRPPMEGFTAAGYADVVVEKSRIITSFSDGVVVAIDAQEGSELWTRDLAAEVTPATTTGAVDLMDADATPCLAGGRLVGASVAGGVYGLDAADGSVAWTRPDVKGVSGLAADSGTVYAARSGFGVTALDPTTGSTIWERAFAAGMLQDPLLHDDVLILSDSVAGLYVVSAGSGDLLQRIDLRDGFFARPSAYAGYLLVMANGGTLIGMSVL